MADVTGPIATLPGSKHDVPEGMMCDDHPDRPAVKRIQGETDSFGSELIDMCEQCYEEYKAEKEAAGPRIGTCDWCKASGVEIKPHRDFEEGMAGRVYDVCKPCIKKENEELERDAAANDPHYYDEPDDDDFGPTDYDDEEDEPPLHGNDEDEA